MRGSCFIAGLACFFMGCAGASGGAASPASRPAAVAAPAELKSLTFLLVPEGPSTPTAAASVEALRSGLVRAGYKVVIDRHAPHDVDIVTRVSATEERSLFAVAVSVNGQRDITEKVRLTGSVVSRGEVLDELSADFVSTNHQVTQDDVVTAVNGLAASERVAQFSKDTQEQASARQQAAQERAEQAKKLADDNAKTKQRLDEESDWNSARVTACSQPIRLNGCDAVRSYLAKYPEGKHVDEAQAALKASEPAMEKLQKDENAWRTSGVFACKAERTHEACTGVELYIAKFPVGMHLDEAQWLIGGIE